MFLANHFVFLNGQWLKRQTQKPSLYCFCHLKDTHSILDQIKDLVFWYRTVQIPSDLEHDTAICAIDGIVFFPAVPEIEQMSIHTSCLWHSSFRPAGAVFTKEHARRLRKLTFRKPPTTQTSSQPIGLKILQVQCP